MTSSSTISRRRVLKGAGIAALGSGATALLSSSKLAAQGGAPAIATNNQAGRKFKAFVKFSKDLPTVVEVTARGLTGNQVLLRVEAAQTCYSSTDQVLLNDERIPTTNASIVGHGGVGVVEAVGPQVMSTRVGDRVILNLHGACGRCFNCLNMRSDKCRSGQAGPQQPIATMASGAPVFGRTGAMSELAITGEEMITPLFYQGVSPAEIAMLTCVGGCGLGMTMTNCPVDVASDVVIFGGGPIGLASVMGAKLKGASKIILVEPIQYRRELGMKLGATHVVDPNQFTTRTPIPNAGGNSDHFKDALVDHLRELTKENHDRVWSGAGRNGPHHVIEAVGGDRLKPRNQPQGPDPTGVTVLNQCWELGSSIGSIVTCSVGHPNDAFVKLPAAQWADGAKHHWPGTGGGTNDRRDSGRYVRLMETGQINMKALVGKTYPLSQTREAYEVCAHREVISTVVLPNG
ncbi:MAG: alcohol dehydrogenase catalytic domain-containing protein [Vicinamibacterales bacterium]